ncbi:uncharacterized protein LOC134259125 [Saccostrea cucullata]|uniref:uncharacterized protein LOC134259125 n=1 Tax=Saccostrea cuccullata TaxID=36930 RepID=UPI002ED1930C
MSLTSLVDRENISEQHTEDEREEEPNEDNTSTAPADATFHISLGSLIDPEDRPVIDPEDRPVVDPEDRPVIDPEDRPVVDPEDRPVVDPEDRPVNQQEDQSFVADTSFAVPAPVNEDSIREEIIGDIPEEDEAVVAEYAVVDAGTKRGKRKLVDNRGFQYTIKKQRGDGSIYWRCSKRGKEQHCPATVIQKGDTFQEGLKNHVHPAEPGVHLAIKMKAEVKKKAVDNIFTESAPRIVENVMNAASDVDAPPASRPKPANMTRIVNRVRQNLRPQDPKDLDFELDMGFLEHQMPDFRHVDVYVSGRRHLLMYTDYQLQLLAKAKTWYLDATFRVVNKPWYQLFTIHSFIRSGANMKQIPLAFCFMSSKRKADYYEVLRTIDHLLPDNISLHGFVVDFEAAIWRAVQERFPGYVIQGCVFHWTQAVYRKAQELGLQRAYNTRGEVHEFIRQVLALPFLPPEHKVETFHHLDRHVQTDLLDSLMEYVWRQWLNNPTFPVRNWSVFMLAIRTNNNVEGWHNSRVGQKCPVPFYLLLVGLHKEAKQIPLQAKLISEGKMVLIHKKRTTNINGKLFAAWKQYPEGEMTSSQLLRRCANVYGPSD